MDMLDRLKEKYPGAETFSFGDSDEMSAELLALVISGQKTATCGALRDFGDGLEALPEVGRRDIALDHTGAPAAVIETVEVRTMPFSQVDDQFAHDEGEGDRTLAWWREAHRTYFERNGGFDPEMMLVCERFRLVEAV